MCCIPYRYQISFIVIFTIITNNLIQPLDASFYCDRASEKHFPCKLPQPRAIILSEEAPDLRNLSFVPYMVVLYRCGQAGCCPLGQICKASQTTQLIVSDVFIKINGNYSPYENVEVSNETQCSCQNH